MGGVLVTGASGFLGGHLLPLLVDGGYEVHAVSRTASHVSCSSRIRWHQVDLLDRQQANDLVRKVLPEQLIHLAWYTSPPLYWQAAENVSWLEASVSLFQEFTNSGGRRMVALGSCAEYDWSGGYCGEDTTPLTPATRYGQCKKELYLKLSELAKHSGVAVAWTRVFFPYGPGEHSSKLVSHVAASLLTGATAECSTPDFQRDFIYAGDAASALVAVLQSGFCGAVNIGTGVAISVGEMAERIAQKIGRAELLRFKSSKVVSNASSLVVANVGRLRDEVGWVPAYSLDEGIEKTIAYCRDGLNP